MKRVFLMLLVFSGLALSTFLVLSKYGPPKKWEPAIDPASEKIIGWWMADLIQPTGFRGYSFDAEGNMYLLGIGDSAYRGETDPLSGLAQQVRFGVKVHNGYIEIKVYGEEGEQGTVYRAAWAISTDGKHLTLSSTADFFRRGLAPPLGRFHRVR